MKFNLAVFDIYSKTMVVESAVVDFKGLVAILGNLGGIRDITITDDYSFLKSSNGVSITSRKAGGPAYRFDISLVKDEKVDEASEPIVRRHDTFELSVTDKERNCPLIANRVVNQDGIALALETFCGMDTSAITNVLRGIRANPYKPFDMGGEQTSEYTYHVTVIGRN